MRKCSLLFALFMLPVLSANAQLTGIIPAQGTPNQLLQTTITGNGIFVQMSTPSGNLYQIQLIKGADVIPIFDFWAWWFQNTQVVDVNTVFTEFTVPSNAVAGLYDLHVTTGDPWYPPMSQSNYVLPGAFTIGPPDGYISGTVYEDLDKDGIKDAGEPGLANFPMKLLPANQSFYTDATGNYNLPVSNGTYSVVALTNTNPYLFIYSVNDTLPVTINNGNSTGNDFGFKHALHSVTPDFAYRGMTSTHQIVSDLPIFIPGAQPYGNVSQIRILSSPAINVWTSSITVIDSFTVRFVLNVPAGTTVANNRDLYVFTNSGYYGYHYLKQKFDIVTPPSFVSGKLFFDRNLNKQYDAGEPGLSFSKTQLLPDSSIAFSDYSGNFLLGSTGGQQVLSFDYIPGGLALFTDSLTYTFNATGNITGKDFGFISTEPDYSVQVKSLYIFPRCFSVQYAQFWVRNTSNVYYNATAWLWKPPIVNFVSSIPSSASNSNDTIYWNIYNLAPYSEICILALLQLPGPGTQINLTAGARSLDGGNVVQQSASISKVSTVLCAYDPNDKQATPEGILTDHYTYMFDPLEYQVRFQNTGNDTAFKVVIVDTLDNDLNFDSFEILESSHSMRAELEKTGVVTFTFDNIQLPDSNINEPRSHGYLRYRVQTKNGLPDSTMVYNTAHIFFDFNEAVVTNTTFNTMVYVLPGGPLPVDLIHFDATPEDDRIALKWVTASETNNAYFTIEKSIDGIHYEILGHVPGAGTSSVTNTYLFSDQDPVKGLQYYRLSQTDYDGEIKVFPPIAVVWSTDQGFHVYPNPSDGTLFINVPEAFVHQTGALTISDMTGRLIISKEVSIGNDAFGTPLLSASDKISAGIYLLKIDFAGTRFIRQIVIR